MDEPTLALTITSLSVFAVFVGLFLWGLITGQFKKIEEPKYRMLKMTETTNQSEEKNTLGITNVEDNQKEGDDENGTTT